MLTKKLGKITSIDIENIDGHFGLFITLEGGGCGVNDYFGKNYIVDKIQKLMKDAKVSKMFLLKNKPVEITFEGNLLKEWRILTEVL